MSQACSISTRKVYGLQRVCQVWGFPRSTVYAQRQAGAGVAEAGGEAPQRRGPQGPCAGGPLLGHIRRVLAETPFHGEGYRKVWAKLRWEGIRTSKERVRRLMGEHQLQAPGRVGQAHGPKAHDGVITTDHLDQM